MLIEMLQGKIHRATVTQAELDYVGSITLDPELTEAAHMREYQKVLVADVDNGRRFETYIIHGRRGSGIVCVNGAAAHCVEVGHRVIIMAFAACTPDECDDASCQPAVVFVDDENHIVCETRAEKPGRVDFLP